MQLKFDIRFAKLIVWVQFPVFIHLSFRYPELPYGAVLAVYLLPPLGWYKYSLDSNGLPF